MSFSIRTITTNNKWPSFIQQPLSRVMESKIDKIFPRLGLGRCEMPIKTIPGMTGPYRELHDRISHDYLSEITIDPDKRDVRSAEAVYILSQIDGPKAHRDITSHRDEIICRAGQPTTRLMLRYLPDLDYQVVTKDLVAQFSGRKVSRYRAVFSHRPWDIATMSQRGITSCQSWNESHLKTALVGSMLCPYTAIAYLTDGEKTPHGERMLVRSVVRYVVNNDTHRPAIFIDDPYFNQTMFGEGFKDEQEDAFDIYTRMFARLIRRNLSNRRTPILTAAFDPSNSHHIPLSELVSRLSDDARSYRDTPFNYERQPTKRPVPFAIHV